MSDLIRQSVSWPSIYGARSYSRVTQLAQPSAADSSEKTEEADRPRTTKAQNVSTEPTTRRGSLLDLTA
ncbi:hypothetical protein CCC_00242 [Paramagnetospirillum magnetotacticum MS-1]|uniref:Uncharacterized protein n=1 Tax=Paramagnetospirillum magnetotacticum MS-1 TaxID=272627 RepID=A0A0C2UWJ9_PARME|nr:hypothetical protein [Paramagnetospirillum magnetotacticum]KIL97181.1 hypothetical protein CCC_00242 [Paramagnetospirillum magnetotacticum MS-1]